MKIYDISQELFSCRVYPGDCCPTYSRLVSIDKGDICNLTNIAMCAHNGTHVDAPYHFYNNGKTIDEMDLTRVIGEATVVEIQGEVTADHIHHIMKTAKKRLLIKGNAVVSLEAAVAMNEYGILLIGNEAQSVGPMEAPADVHYELLKNEVVLLEGIELSHVPEGDYLLNAAPLNLQGADGSPCRAILISGVEVK